VIAPHPAWAGRVLSLLIAGVLTAAAHTEPTSFIDLRKTADGFDLTLNASTTDLAHDLPDVEPAMLLNPVIAAAEQERLAAIFFSRFEMLANGQPLSGQFRGSEPEPEKSDLRLRFAFASNAGTDALEIRCRLFPYDHRHQTFLNFYQEEKLQRQVVFDAQTEVHSFSLLAPQSAAAVIFRFIAQGVHHIAIGPDHILFVVGLLLAGGSFGVLLRIITAFTLAHSITLAMAVLGLVNPPPGFIEPLIALSIVFVGLHTLLRKPGRDPRMLFAFGFGLIHGFGFAYALQAMELPRRALALSLVSFNVGVEVGQACIVALIAPALWWLHLRHPSLARRVVTVGSLCVAAAGAVWFVQRVAFSE